MHSGTFRGKRKARTVGAALRELSPGEQMELLTGICGPEVKTAAPGHTGNKYLRPLRSTRPDAPGHVDVYDVIVAFKVEGPGAQHAVKKLLCAGLRGKGSRRQDLEEAIDSIKRQIELDAAAAPEAASDA